MVTGRFDTSSLKKNKELREKCREQSGGVTDVPCPILGESTMQNIDGESTVPNKVCGHCASNPLLFPPPTPITQVEFASTARAILWYFGHKDLASEFLAADGVHNLGNLLSLSSDMHSQFDSLGLWFEATDAVRY